MRDGRITGAAGTSLPGLAQIPSELPGDTENLQVYYAEQRLREIGVPTQIQPATFRTHKADDIQLIFAIKNARYVYCPQFGVFQLQSQGLVTSAATTSQ